MSVGVLLALARATDTGGPTALLRYGSTTLLARVAAQLRGCGVDGLVVVTQPAWVVQCKQALADANLTADVRDAADVHQALGRIEDCARASRGPIVVAHADILMHDAVVEALLADSRIASGLLVGEDGRGETWDVRVERDRVASAASAYHRVRAPSARSLGVLRIDESDRTVLSDVAVAITATIAPGLSADADPLALLVAGVARAGGTLRTAHVRELFWSRPASQDEANEDARALEDIDEDRVVLDAAVKTKDGFFVTFFISPYSRYIARWAARRGISPNQVTAFSFALGVSAAAWFAVGTRPALVVGGVLLYLTLVFDCVDGQLARYTRSFTPLGAWLDPMFDRAKEYIAFAGLAYGAVRTGGDERDLWLLAGAAIALQTVRHFMDFTFSSRTAAAAASPARVPLDAVWDDPPASADDDQGALDDPEPASGTRTASATGVRAIGHRLLGSDAKREPATITWVRRIMMLPIGERYALIALTAAIAGARHVFIVLLGWGAYALAYAMLGRVMRSVM